MVPPQDVDISKRRDLWGTRKCELCNVVTANQVEWEKHLSNSKHKKRVQGKKKMEEVREFLRLRELEKTKKESELTVAQSDETSTGSIEKGESVGTEDGVIWQNRSG